MTEPPTLRKLVVCMIHLHGHKLYLNITPTYFFIQVLSLILRAFFAQVNGMEFSLWMSLLFGGGYLLGHCHSHRWRRDRIALTRRWLQLTVLSLELKSLRSKVVSAQGRRTPPAQRRLVRKLPTL